MKHSQRWMLEMLFGYAVATAAHAQSPPSQTAVPNAVQATQPESVARGVELTRRAQVARNPVERDEALRQAETIYAKAAQADPKSGAALNNLAVLAVYKGDTAAARQYFERAIAANDGHKALYALNYSKYLQATDAPAAIQAARLAVKEAPDSATANQHLGSLLWQKNRAELLPFASDLAARGHTNLATQFAMQCLTSQSRPVSERHAWMILLAQRAAREYAISEDTRKALSADLAKLESDPVVGRGSVQLRAVIENPPTSASSLDWWLGQTRAPTPDGVSGQAAMRAVLLAAGEFNASRDATRARGYLTAAIDFGEHGPDPDAFLRLVELYANHGTEEQLVSATKSLSEVMARYQQAMFQEKSAAYASQNWRLIYRMHVALGMTYAYLKTWRSDISYQNAIFQLSHAMSAAEQANREVLLNEPKLALPPVGIEKLAEGYMQIGRKDQALRARIDGATALNRIGHVRDSADVFNSIPAIEVGSLDEAARSKYETLRKAVLGL